MTFREKHTRYRFINSLPKGAIVLDIGCGDGRIQNHLKQYRSDLKFISVDKYDFSKECNFDSFFKVDITIEKLPIPDKSVDAVFCVHVLEHLVSCDLLCSEIKRVLKPKANVYIEAPSTRSLYTPSFSMLKGDYGTINFYDDLTHIKPFTQHSLSHVGEKMGLTEIKTGFARNWVYCLLAPIILIYAVIKRDRQIFGVILWSIVGWSVYVWGRNDDHGISRTQ